MAADRPGIHGHPDRDKRRSDPKGEPVRRRCRAVWTDPDLCQEEAKTRHHKTEPHQSKAGAYPREERSLFGEIIPHVSPWLSSAGALHSWRLTPKHLRGRQ